MRREILQSLVTLSAPLSDIRQQLRDLKWDSDDEYIVTKADILAVLYKAASRQVSEQDLSDWAELIEGRDDIGFSDLDADNLKKVIYEAANPTLFGKPSANIKSWILLLSK
jgi:hypothetical protein